MCSITDQVVTAASRGARLAALVAHHQEIGRLITDELRDDAGNVAGGDGIGSLHPDILADLTVTLLASADRATAAATVLAGQVTATTGLGTGTLIAGTYASPRRWLEVDAGLAPSSAKAVLARGRDLREQAGPVKDAWLAGEVSGDKVRELTAGVVSALKTVQTTREEKERLRSEAVDVLLPVAKLGTTADLKRAVGRLGQLAESAYEDPEREAQRAQAAVEAYDDQSLTCTRVGDLFRLEAWLLPETAAATMTVVDAYARRIVDRDPDVVHDPACPLAAPPQPLTNDATGFQPQRWCTCGASAAAGVTSKDRWPHLLAIAFGELMTNHLDDGRVGSHHGIAPHVTMQVTLDQLHAGLGADLTIPGSDEPTPLSTAAAQRILCDADLTHVIVRRTTTSTDLTAEVVDDSHPAAVNASTDHSTHAATGEAHDPVTESSAVAGERDGSSHVATNRGTREDAIDGACHESISGAHARSAVDATTGTREGATTGTHAGATTGAREVETTGTQEGATDCTGDDLRLLVDRLTDAAVEVLYVGRARRTVTPRQRRALEARDRHCIFPGCRAHPRRCHAHHVQEWENDGPTDISNLALLCVRHHISVHEGGWQITPTPGVGPHETGCWTLSPPRTQP